MKILLSFILSLNLLSCAYSVHQVHTSDYQGMKASARPIEASSSQFVVLGFKAETDYVEAAYQDLLSKCKGPITGITTKFSTDLGFLSWTNRVKMMGFCL